MFVSVGQAASMLGVSLSTMRRWEDEGFPLPSFRTFGGHSRCALENLEQVLLDSNSQSYMSSKKAVSCARVSSHVQKSDLETQKLKLTSYCAQHFLNFEITDLGSGLIYKKPSLKLNGRRSHQSRRAVAS